MRNFWAGLVAIVAAVGPITSVQAEMARDEHSYAHLDEVRIKHVYLDLDVSFDKKQLAGFAELNLDWRKPAAKRLDLDTRDLSIERVSAQRIDGSWVNASFALAKRDAKFGSQLTIRLKDAAPKVRVYYHTAPTASGLQWLAPAQTLGKQKPFMFSQAEAIHARSFAPLQDTPTVRFTYRARVTAPEGIRVVMSADNEPSSDGRGGFRFNMPQAIPSYLLAIAAGDIAAKQVGPRSFVWTEPGRVDVVAKEFEDIEAMIAAAEKLYGPYRWGRYDMLVLPPSFPFGGMENPRLSFLTPTLIAGDKSLVNVVAHELAHSWSGNLATNATWRDIWLNEGFTSYVENRIVEAVFGVDQAVMDQVVGQQELLAEMKELPAIDQHLVLNLKDRDPDDAFSGVPYQKGEWMLRTLEQRFGRDKFDAVVRAWFDEHAFQSVSTEQFLDFFGTRLLDAKDSPIHRADLDVWLYQPGVPKNALLAHSAKLEAIDGLLADFVAGKKDAAALNAKTWSTGEWVHFLNGYGDNADATKMADLDANYGLTQRLNREITMRWFLAGIRANYTPMRDALRAHLIEIGRRKLMVPLWGELAKTPANKAWAIDVYQVARAGLHPIAQNTLDAMLGLKP
ncbi:MAG: M1 family metallopeptidase [Rhodanobacteraceae bacterium]|nr:M1 family metallopeptidase [Rhodanobacteraceae bacterium]MBP9154281.1 M1 family metallopeptidase [Xanthomonadales bacterium]HQW81664.1 M1 family metallopeptidase [Pseudomonadota bacterium]